MLDFKNIVTNNRMFFGSVATSQILANILVLTLYLLYFNEYSLVPILFVTFINIALNLYVLRWSSKHKIYASESFLKTKLSNAFFTDLFFFCLFVINTSAQCLVVFCVFGLFDYLSGVSFEQYKEHFVIFTILWVVFALSFAFLILFNGLLHVFRTTSIVGKLYPEPTAKYISAFKLDINETQFCTSGSGIVGFVSAGFICNADGIVYKGAVFKKSSVVEYLNNTGLKLSELDAAQLEILRMYDYAK